MLPALVALLLWTTPSHETTWGPARENCYFADFRLPGPFASHLESGIQAELAHVRELVEAESDPLKRVVIITNALAARKSADNPYELGAYRIMLGDAYCKAGKAAEASQAYREALPLVMSYSPTPRMDQLNEMAKHLHEAKDDLRATPFMKEAVRTARNAGNTHDLAELSLTLGSICVDSADRDLAYEVSIEAARADNYQTLMGEGYAAMAYEGFLRNDYARATFYFESALAVPGWTDEKSRITAERVIIVCSGFLGDWRRAEKYGPAVYENYLKAGKKDDAAMVLNDIAYASAEAKRYSIALAGYKKALAATSATNKQQRASILYNEGMALQENGNLNEALALFGQSLAQARGVDDTREANCESSIGMVLVLQSKQASALPHLLRASKAIPDVDDIGFPVVTLENLEKCYRALGKKKEADDTALLLDRTLLDHVGNEEVLRVAAGTTIPGIADFGSASFIYSLATSQAIRRGQLNSAFRFAERAKARLMVDIESRNPIDASKLTVYERESYDWLRDHVRKLQQGNGSEQGPGGVQGALKLSLDELNAYEGLLRASIGQRDPGSVFKRIKDRQKLDQIDKDMGAIPSDTVFMEVIQTGSTKLDQVAVILAWSERGKTQFSSNTLKENGRVLSVKEVENLSLDFAKSCGANSTYSSRRGGLISVDGGSEKSGDRLRALLIDPIRTKLARFKRIVISPDASIWRLPIEALPLENGQRVIDRWEIDYCYSASQWLMSMHERPHIDPNFAMLLVANPDFGGIPESGLETQFAGRAARGEGLPPLPGTKIEAAKIRGVTPRVTYLTGDQAQADRIKSLMPRYGILHFATHGLFDSYNPMASSLACAKLKGGQTATELVADDIQRMPLTARLAVLSACDTGRGVFRRSEGPVGLTYAFLRAGCPTVISSRWPVNDQTTAELMADFYRGLAKGQKIGAALRSAILRSKKRHPEPYHWASFMLFGDSRK